MYDGIHHWIKHTPLIEADYPYTAREGTCKENNKDAIDRSPVKKIKGVQWMKEDCDTLKASLEFGPQSVAVDAGRAAWQLYSKGIVTNNCQMRNLNHGVVAVGWGVEKGVEYFLLKNSWGARWGESGYI